MSRNKNSCRDRRRSISLTARRLGEVSIASLEVGEWAYRIQSDKSVYWHFRSLEAATAMADHLVKMDRDPGSRQNFVRRSGRIDCFEMLIFPEDIGAIPTRLLVFDREAGDWTEMWSGNAAGVGAVIAKRKRTTPTTAQTQMMQPSPP